MKLIRNIILITLLIVGTAIISYQLLNNPVKNEEQEDLDSKVKNKIESNNQLSNLIIREQKDLKQNEESFQLLKKPLLELKEEPKYNTEFKLDYPRLELNVAEENVDKLEVDFKSKFLEKEVENKELKIFEANDKDIFLGIKDGYVAIYEGDILEEKELLQVRKDIPLKSLASEDIKKLQLGIKVKNRKELLGILEGFLSAQN